MQLGPLEVQAIKRLEPSKLEILVVSFLTVVMAFVAFSLVFFQAGVDPLDAYWRLITFSFFSASGLEFTIRRATFFLLVTLTFVVPMRAGIWNIGAPGQVFAGMSAALAVAVAAPELSPVLLLPLMFIAAFTAGAALAGLAGYLIGRHSVDSVVLTIMLNFSMVFFVLWLIEEPLNDPSGRMESIQVPLAGRIPMILDTSIPYTLIPALLIAVLLFFLFQNTRLGYEIEAFGNNPEAARVAGISFTKVALITMVLGGAIAGLAGLHQVAGEPGVYRITSGYWTNVGMWSFYGIVFGLLAYNNPVASILPAFVFAGFQVGSRRFEYLLGMNHGVDLAFFGTLMIVLVIGQFFYVYKLSWTFHRGED